MFLPVNSPVYRYNTGDSVMVYTSMIVKEDDMKLYGFHNKDSLELFEKLITVSGVGAKGAMSIIGTFSADELKRAIAFEDSKEISRANGIGKKTAERIILELKIRWEVSIARVRLFLPMSLKNFLKTQEMKR